MVQAWMIWFRVFKWTVWFIRTIQVGTVPQKQKGPKKFEIFQAPSYKTQKDFSAPEKKYLCVGGEYIPLEIRIQIQTIRKLLG